MLKKLFRRLMGNWTRPRSVKIQAVRTDSGCIRLDCMARGCNWSQTVRPPESDQDISARHAALHLFENS